MSGHCAKGSFLPALSLKHRLFNIIFISRLSMIVRVNVFLIMTVVVDSD